MSFSSAALEELCLRVIFSSVRQLFDLDKLVLPKVYRDRLTYMFIDLKKRKFEQNLLCLETLPLVDDSEYTPGYRNLLRMNALDNWDWTTPSPLPADLFAYLFQQNLEYNSFFIESPTHFVSVRYRKCKPDTVPYDLCRPCFLRDLDYYVSTYTRYREHHVYSSGTAIMYVLESKNWCSNCVTTPLFSIFDTEGCRRFTGLHRRVRPRSDMFWSLNNVHSDDDSDDDSFVPDTVQHPGLKRKLV